MIDQIDVNVQALGALAHRVGNSGTENEVAASPHDFGPDFIDAVSVHTYPFGKTMAEPPFELFNDEKTVDRAWRYPYLGGDVTMQQENAVVHAEPTLRRENLIGSEGVRDPVYSGVNAVLDRDFLNPVPPRLPQVIQVMVEPSGASAHSGAGTDLPRDMVNLMSSERALQANAQAVRTVEQTGGTVLNMFA